LLHVINIDKLNNVAPHYLLD